jgi:hypothetical protein
MKKNYLILIIIGILIVGIVLWFGFRELNDSEPECITDSDCEFFWADYRNRICGSCDLGDEGFVCMNKEKVKEEWEKLQEEGIFNNLGVCARCSCRNDNYVCECIKNKCTKQEKVFHDLKEECEIAGGTWKPFNSACADTCDFVRNPTTHFCAQLLTESCDCGDDKCWNGETCEDN